MKKVAVAAVVGILAFSAKASPLAIPVKAVGNGISKVCAKIGGKVADAAVGRSASALAKATGMRKAARGAGDAMKHITAGKILAVGGASALVTGVHEASDGIQMMGEGVKETLREHPEAVGKVVGWVVAPVALAVVVAVGLAVLFLCWLVWPWLVVFRKWCKLRALKKESAMQAKEAAFGASASKGASSVCTQVIDIPVADVRESRSGRIGVRILFLLFAIGLFVAIGVAFISCSVGWDKWFEKFSVAADAAKIECRNRMMQKFSSDYSGLVEAGYRRFCEDVEKTAAMEYAAVQAEVPAIAARFGMFARLKDYCILMAKDKLKRGNRLEQRIADDLEVDYYRNLYSARDRVLLCLERFAYDVKLARKAYRIKAENELAAGVLPGDEAYSKVLEGCGKNIDEVSSALESAQKKAVISATMDIVFVRQTGAIFAKVLGKAVSRQVATMSGGLAASAVDGPLPIIDAVVFAATVGCTFWTCLEIREATTVLPKKLHDALSKATEKSKAECISEVLMLGEKIRERALKP